MKILYILFLALLINNVGAQTLELVVSASAGGPTDTISRNISDIIESNSSIKIIILNKPGGGHTIAYNYILNSNKGQIIISTPEIKKHKVYDQLIGVSNLGTFSIYVFSNINSKYKQLNNVYTANKEILFGYSGINTYSYLGLQEICKNVSCLPVPYKSGSEGIFGIKSNQIDLYALVSFGSKSFLEDKNLNLVTKLYNPDNKLILFSKNVPLDIIENIRHILEKNLNKNFLKDMGFEVN